MSKSITLHNKAFKNSTGDAKPSKKRFVQVMEIFTKVQEIFQRDNYSYFI